MTGESVAEQQKQNDQQWDKNQIVCAGPRCTEYDMQNYTCSWNPVFRIQLKVW